MFKASTFQEILLLVKDFSSDFPQPLSLREDKSVVEPRLRFKENKIFFSNACISTILLYELYYKHKKDIHRILLYNILISINFQKGYLNNIQFLLFKLEQEINKFCNKNIYIDGYLNTENIIAFLLGHELWHAKFKYNQELRNEKIDEIRNIIINPCKNVDPKTLREKAAFEGLYDYINRNRLIEEFACDRNGILDFFSNSISPVLKQHEIIEVAKQIVRVIAMRQFPLNMATASKTITSVASIREYRNIHRADILRIGLATFSVIECLGNLIDYSFIDTFSKETLKYHKVMSYTFVDWLKQFNTLAKASNEQLIEDDRLFDNLQNHFDQLQLELIQIIECKANIR